MQSSQFLASFCDDSESNICILLLWTISCPLVSGRMGDTVGTRVHASRYRQLIGCSSSNHVVVCTVAAITPFSNRDAIKSAHVLIYLTVWKICITYVRKCPTMTSEICNSSSGYKPKLQINGYYILCKCASYLSLIKHKAVDESW